MRNALFCLSLSLAACGGHDFTGTWTGSIERTTAATGATATVFEHWVVDDRETRVVRTRGAETCTLSVSDSAGYDLALAPGQPCTLDGAQLVLLDGRLEWTSGGTTASLAWAPAMDAPTAITEDGALDQD